MKNYITDWAARLAIMTAFTVLSRVPWTSLAVAVIFLLVIDLFQYAYRTYGDKKQ